MPSVLVPPLPSNVSESTANVTSSTRNRLRNYNDSKFKAEAKKALAAIANKKKPMIVFKRLK